MKQYKVYFLNIERNKYVEKVITKTHFLDPPRGPKPYIWL